MQPRDKPHLVQRHAAILHWRASRLSPNMRSLLWSIAAGMLLMTLNTSVRALAQHLAPMRYERSQVIVFWQCVAITLYSLPLALFDWRPVSGGQWLLFALAGVLGTAGQFCLTRSVAVADLTVSQSTRFLDLVWASLLGWVVFGDIASGWTLAGGTVICAATLWVVQREARGPR